MSPIYTGTPEEEKQNDLRAQGFDKLLNKDVPKQSPPDAKHGFKDIPGSIILGAQEMGSSLSFGTQLVTVPVGQNIQKAIDTVASKGGGTVRLLPETYNVDYNIELREGVALIGEGIDTTIIDFNDREYAVEGIGTSDNILENIYVTSLTIQNSDATAGLSMKFADNWLLESVKIYSCNTSGFRSLESQNWHINKCRAEYNGSSGFYIPSTSNRPTRDFYITDCFSSKNGFNGYRFDANLNDLFFGSLVACHALLNSLDGFEFEANSGSALDLNVVSCLAYQNSVNGFDVDDDCQRIGFSACQADLNTDDGFEIQGLNHRLIGCWSNTPYDLRSSISFVGNSAHGGSSVDPKTQTILEDDEQIQSEVNQNQNTRTLRRAMIMKNTSGGELNVGDVVVLKATASGDEIDVTTTAGDDNVYGMVDVTIAHGSWGRVLVEGYTTRLKVDGTTDIAIGDFLSTYDLTSKVAQKASSGDMAFAKALEEYTTDDSNGVIDALIIKPRKI